MRRSYAVASVPRVVPGMYAPVHPRADGLGSGDIHGPTRRMAFCS